jgi:hypothetical protein
MLSFLRKTTIGSLSGILVFASISVAHADPYDACQTEYMAYLSANSTYMSAGSTYYTAARAVGPKKDVFINKKAGVGLTAVSLLIKRGVITGADPYSTQTQAQVRTLNGQLLDEMVTAYVDYKDYKENADAKKDLADTALQASAAAKIAYFQCLLDPPM